MNAGASPVMYVPKPGWFKAVIQSHDCHSGKPDKQVVQVGARAPMIDAAFDFHNHKLRRLLHEVAGPHDGRVSTAQIVCRRTICRT